MNARCSRIRNVSVIILAAGMATRLAPLRTPLAKAMLPIADHPYIGYLAAHYLRCGVASVLIAAGHRGEQIADYFKGEPWNGYPVTVHISQPLGTGYNLVGAARMVDTSLVLLIMGDVVVDFNLNDLLHDFRDHPASCTLVVCNHSPQNEGALAVDANGLLLASAEAGAGAARFEGTIHARKSSTGAAVIDRDALTTVKADPGFSMERDLFPLWIGAGRMRVFDIGDAFYWDFGTPERYEFITGMADVVTRLYGAPYPNPAAGGTMPPDN